MTLPGSDASQHLEWARGEVLDLLSDLTLTSDDAGAKRVAARVERLWRATASPEARLAVLYQFCAVVNGAAEVVGEVDPEIHPVEVSAAIGRRLPGGVAGRSPRRRLSV